MRMKWRFKSMRSRLSIWFLVVAMVPVIVVVTTLYFQRSAVIRGREFEKLQTIRDLKVRELTGWLDERSGDLMVAAGDHEIRVLESALAKESGQWTQEDLRDVEVARGLMQRYVDGYEAYHEMFIVSARTAKVIVSSEPLREGRDKREDEYFTVPMRTKKRHITDIHHSKTEGKAAMSFSTPIRCLDHDAEHVVGILVLRVDLENSLYPFLQEHTGYGKTGETLIVNKDGMAVNVLRWEGHAPLKLKIPGEAAVRAVAGETGIVETTDYRGEKVIAAYTHIPRMGWGFVAKRDVAEVYAPIRAMLRDMGIILAASAAAALSLALLLARTLSRPILALGETVHRVAEGDLTARYAREGSDEVAALGASFNEMADNLASQMAVQQGGAVMARTMAAAGNVESFASNVLTTLLDITGSQLGAFYLRSEDGRTFEHVTSVGLAAEAAPRFSAETREGELGKTVTTGEISLIRDIPESTVFTFKMTAGTAVPREIVTVPFVVEGRVVAIASMATLGTYTEDHRSILDQAQIGMNTAFANLLASDRTARLAEKLQDSNEELASLNEELQTQTEELQQQAEELQVQRKQVEEANRLKSEFLSNMSHELRTPLNSVMALSQLMISRGIGKDPAQEAEYLQVIERNGRQLLNLINDILDLSKIEAGRAEVHLGEVFPEEITEAALVTVRPLIEEKDLTLTVHVADDVPTMRSDPDKVRQILLNLLSNAVKFTGAGDIGVTVSAEGDFVSFAVTDSGVGIGPQDREHIFDEFRQVDGSTTRKYAGTGLGLAICRRLARLLGGDISLHSTLDAGSTFTLTLPVEAPAGLGVAGAMDRPAQASAAGARRGTILVVDDDTAARNLLKEYLTGAGFTVVVATGGQEGLRLARQLRPDVVTLDVLMPEMDGWEVIRQLKADERTAHIPVVIVSVTQDRATGRALGAAGYIVKPIDKRLLLAELDRISTMRKIRRILVADDDAVARDHLRGILTQRGYLVRTASGGKEALEVAASELPPDAMILDLMMPEVDGFTVLDELRRSPKTASLPVIIVTAKDLTPAERASLTETTRRIVTKGRMEKDDLLREIETVLAELRPPGPGSPPADEPHVLVVEDNDVAALQIRTALEASGYRVVVASGGAEALAAIKKAVPDGVVLDLMMPEVDGFAVLQEIRATPWTVSLPVLVLTAKELTADDRARLKQNNVQQLIQKGAIEREELIAQVDRMLGRGAAKEPGGSPVERQDAGPAWEPTPVGGGLGAAISGKTVLVVEDNPDNLLTITAILREIGVDAVVATNGREAVALAEGTRPDLILMDIQLPLLSGLDAAREIKANAGLKGIPIIALTAKAMKGDREEALAAGCDGYLSKPVDPRRLREVMAKWLGG